MRLLAIVVLIAILISEPAKSIEPSPDLAKAVAHCLLTHASVLGYKHGLADEILSFGFDLDTESYSSQRAIYAVSYRRKRDFGGLVYLIFEQQKGSERFLLIENNAKFVRKKQRIEYTEPPLGGVWTQQHLEAAINRIDSKPRIQFSEKELREEDPHLQCESYADPK